MKLKLRPKPAVFAAAVAVVAVVSVFAARAFIVPAPPVAKEDKYTVMFCQGMYPLLVDVHHLKTGQVDRFVLDKSGQTVEFTAVLGDMLTFRADLAHPFPSEAPPRPSYPGAVYATLFRLTGEKPPEKASAGYGMVDQDKDTFSCVVGGQEFEKLLKQGIWH